MGTESEMGRYHDEDRIGVVGEGFVLGSVS